MNLRLVSAPEIEPVSLEEVKLHLRVDHDDDDALITGLIAAARGYAETVTRRALLTQSWELRFDDWPGRLFELPLPPLQAVEEISYLDETGAEHLVDEAVFGADVYAQPGRVYLKPGQSWPSSSLLPASAVCVRFTAGWPNAAAVPAMIRAAIKLTVGHLYENREQVVVASGLAPVDLPLGVDALLATWRVWSF
jgi:uncharacterized phiE125 gp8 family phage protein